MPMAADKKPIVLLTTWDERCGIAEYARNLRESLRWVMDKEIFIYARQCFEPGMFITALQGKHAGAVILFNYEPGLLRAYTPEAIVHLQSMNFKTVLILHTSHEGSNKNRFSEVFDAVVVHEKTDEGFTFIPMGIPLVDVRRVEVNPKSIGTAGFPFPWKGFHQVALAATQLNMDVTVIAPESGHCSTEAMKKVCREANPRCTYIEDYLTQEDVVRELSSNVVNVFAYTGNNYGISGAVRLGLASGRPIVVTRMRQFRDLFDYEDEIEFIPNQSPEEIAAGIQRVLANGKVPKRVLEDMSWGAVADKYKALIDSV